MIALTTSATLIPISSSPWRMSPMATFPSWTLTHTQDHTAHWSILCTEVHPH